MILPPKIILSKHQNKAKFKDLDDNGAMEQKLDVHGFERMALCHRHCIPSTVCLCISDFE